MLYVLLPKEVVLQPVPWLLWRFYVGKGAVFHGIGKLPDPVFAEEELANQHFQQLEIGSRMIYDQICGMLCGEDPQYTV